MEQQSLFSKKEKLGRKMRNSKKEENLQLKVCGYLRDKYPGVIWFCDLASGMKLPIHIAAMNKAMRSHRGLPDLFIACPKSGEGVLSNTQIINGLFIELKSIDAAKKDGTVSSSAHVREQAAIHGMLVEAGYEAVFACGFEQVKGIIDDYFSGNAFCK